MTTIPINIEATDITTIPSTSPCTAGNCVMTVDAIWVNTGGTSETFTPSIKVDNVPVIISPPLVPIAVGPYGTQSQQFILTDLTAGEHIICPNPNGASMIILETFDHIDPYTDTLSLIENFDHIEPYTGTLLLIENFES